jgi:hypothetical protein
MVEIQEIVTNLKKWKYRTNGLRLESGEIFISVFYFKLREKLNNFH